MTDLTTLTDDQIRVKAAEAMGYTHVVDGTGIPPGLVIDQENLAPIPDPLHDLNDAVALAEKYGKRWTLHGWWADEENQCFQVLVGEECTSADSPARALTMAVMKAMEKAVEVTR